MTGDFRANPQDDPHPTEGSPDPKNRRKQPFFVNKNTDLNKSAKYWAWPRNNNKHSTEQDPKRFLKPAEGVKLTALNHIYMLDEVD